VHIATELSSTAASTSFNRPETIAPDGSRV